MLFHPLFAPTNESADRCGRGVKNVDAIVFDDFPEAIGLRPIRRTFVHQRRPARGQRPVDDVAMAGHPADVCGAPEDVFVAKVKDVFS